MALADKSCKACSGSVPALSRAEYEPLLAELDGWNVENDKKLIKSLKLDNFKQSMHLATKIAEIAEQEGHHPDLLVKWGELRIELWTHKIDALTESDFILASKIDRCTNLAGSSN